MALRRVTIQDVADACGLSRNTVSKVFNGRGAVQDSTRQLVLKTAQELGYFQLAFGKETQPELSLKNIALLTRHMPVDNHFGTSLIPAFAAQLGRAGYTLMMYELSDEELRHGALPVHVNPEQTAAILGIELFDRAYLEKICALKLPILLVDGCCGAATSLMPCDWISMENLASTRALVEHLIGKGARRIGFIGDPYHCNSFHERWIGFYSALVNAELPLECGAPAGEDALHPRPGHRALRGCGLARGEVAQDTAAARCADLRQRLYCDSRDDRPQAARPVHPGADHGDGL